MKNTFNLEIKKIYKTESPRVLAGLIRILGDLDLAEDALQEAFSIAMEKWPLEGLPKNPYSWLISTGKFKAIDSIRRLKRGADLHADKFIEQESIDEINLDQHLIEDSYVEDDQLRLIFYCCHPDLPLDSRIALSLKEVCTMSTKEISRAYLVPLETIKKRITRAKSLIKNNHIPYEIPSKDALKGRMAAVLHVIYLIFNEGYSASSGAEHIRKELTDEAIYLCRKLVELNPTSESLGLLALLLLQDSRQNSRLAANGDIIPLEEQDRSLWDKNKINEGVELIHQSVMSGKLGSYTIQAAIASVHALADSIQSTQWDLIVGYYDLLLTVNPSPIIELNRAIAIGMYNGPKAALDIIEELLKNKQLNSYHLIYAIKADFSKRLGLMGEAIAAYQQAINLVSQDREKEYLKKQLALIL